MLGIIFIIIKITFDNLFTYFKLFVLYRYHLILVDKLFIYFRVINDNHKVMIVRQKSALFEQYIT